MSLTPELFRRLPLLGLLVVLPVLLVALVLPARADAAQVSNVRVDFAFTTTNPCTGESVSLEGTTHFLVNVTMDAGGGAHFVENSNTQGTGISASGAKYVLISTGEFVETPASDVVANFTERSTFKLVRQGVGSTADDFTVTILFKGTVVNGEVKVDITRFEAECI
jgi:hypothetical protein